MCDFAVIQIQILKTCLEMKCRKTRRNILTNLRRGSSVEQHVWVCIDTSTEKCVREHVWVCIDMSTEKGIEMEL